MKHTAGKKRFAKMAGALPLKRYYELATAIENFAVRNSKFKKDGIIE